MTAMKIDPPQHLYQVKVTLQKTDPPVWRRLLVRSDTTLLQLHRILQVMLGWKDYHLHEFRVGSVLFGESDPDSGLRRISEKATVLADVLRKVGDRLEYAYDFGDGWEHEILLEEIAELDPEAMYPVVVAGARACPPEDVGGTQQYRSFLRAIADPNDPEHENYLDWCGGSYDPDKFDAKSINMILERRRMQR